MTWIASHSNKKGKASEYIRMPQGKTEPQILIVCGSTLKDERGMCSENTKVLYTVPDMTEQIMCIVVEKLTVQKIILHTCRQIMKQQSEVLK